MKSFLQRTPVIAVILAVVPSVYAVKFQFQSEPTGANVQIVGSAEQLKRVKVTTGMTPVELDLPRSSEPYQIVFTKRGYDRVEHSLSTKADVRTLTATLAQLEVDRPVTIKSDPSGAEIFLDGAQLGRTPLTQSFHFDRTDRKSPWKELRLLLKKTDYQDEETVLSLEQLPTSNATIPVTLGRISEDREFEVLVLDDQGKAIPHADVQLDLTSATRTDESGSARVTIPFRRKDRNSTWSEFTLTSVIPNEYQPVAKKIAHPITGRQEFRLSPVTEVLVKRAFPGTEMTSRGPRLSLDAREMIGILNDRDQNSPAVDLRLVTNYDRRQLNGQSVNSFTVLPDGKNVIFAVTGIADDGKPYSNLYQKGTQSSNSPVAQLTRGSRFIDAFPSISAEENSTLVVFQSTRGVPDTWNISAVRVEGGRVIGGVQQLTRDPRFNYGPSIASEQQPVFFSSVEETPQSPARIASVRPDGTTSTNYSETGEMLYYSPKGSLYLSRLDPQVNKLQIYAITIEGQIFSSVLNDEQFAKANCTWPALSPTGDKLLFVSDYLGDEKGRKNNNIYLCDLHGGAVLQLTDNGSDDIMPKWSPTEPGVIYFLSNRGGVYNVWRMAFRLAQ